MRLFCARLGSAALALAAIGCQPMPQIASVDQQASQAVGLSDPFAFQVDGEPTDVEVPMSQSLTFIAATKLALQHDPGIQQALARVRVAQAEAHQQRLLPNPVLDLALRFPKSGGSTVIDVTITGEILSLIRRPGLISAADSRLRASHAEALASVLDVIAELQKLYISAQALDARIAVTESRRDIFRKLVDVSQARLQAGEASRLDLLTVKADQAMLETELIELRAEQRHVRLALARTIGTPSAIADWRLEPWQAPDSLDATIAQWTSVALQRRPEVQMQVWELEALGEEVKLARLSPLDGTDVGAAAERDGDWSVGPAVAVPIPVFDVGQAQKNAVHARRIEARHQLTSIRRQVVLEVRQAMEQLSSARLALDSVEKQLLPLQQERREQAEDAHRLGLADITSVQLAEQDFQAASSKRIELQEKLSLARVELERAVGGSGVAASVSATTIPSTQPSN
jgi:cobalt-zinc-cadmium efflux system outer membrane protein